MASVVRLKRYFSEEPLETLVINCKRRKTDNDSENDSPDLSALFTFAGTIKNPDEDIFNHIKKTTTTTTKTDLEEQFKKRTIDINAKLRAQKHEDAKHSRYKIINCFRSQNVDDNHQLPVDTNEEQATKLTVYDIELENSTKDRNESETKDKNYVYDLYYTTSDDFGGAQLSEYIDIYPLSDELVFGSARDNGYNDDDDDSEDSNAENDWRNDYPDEDEDIDSITEDDMINAMERCDLSDLSSDNGEESFVYGKDEFDEDTDDVDEQRRYGERFARFMSKHQTLEKAKIGGLYCGDIDDDDD